MDLLCTQEEAEALGYHNPIEAAQQAAIAKERAQAHKQAINYQTSPEAEQRKKDCSRTHDITEKDIVWVQP